MGKKLNSETKQLSASFQLASKTLVLIPGNVSESMEGLNKHEWIFMPEVIIKSGVGPGGFDFNEPPGEADAGTIDLEYIYF